VATAVGFGARQFEDGLDHAPRLVAKSRASTSGPRSGHAVIEELIRSRELGLVAVGAAAPYFLRDFLRGSSREVRARELLAKCARANRIGLVGRVPRTVYYSYRGIETAAVS